MIDFIIIGILGAAVGVLIMGLVCQNTYNDAYEKGFEEGKIAERKRIIKEVNDAFCPKSNSDAS